MRLKAFSQIAGLLAFVGIKRFLEGHAMTEKKGPQMAHAAEEELIGEIESIIDQVSENVDEKELSEREHKANQIVEDVRERAARRERA